jgi:catechol 2,3-dioxygenase-like lactoylglutathione lyase family enzyme
MTDDERPPVAIGHAAIGTADLARATPFWQTVGMRTVFSDDERAIFELRGGTHLIVFAGDGVGDVPFDLMVDDLPATHAAWEAAGLEPTPIQRGNIHDHFTVRDPDGRAVTVNSSHAVGPV